MPIFPLNDRRVTWLGYFFLSVMLSWLCFSSLRHHLLDVPDADSFADHLLIDQDWTVFFSLDKTQASGRPFAEAIKYGAYLLWGNDPAVFHVLVVGVHTLASLLLASLAVRLGMSLGVSMAGGLLFLLNVAHFQAVHHISALDYPLALVCGLLSLHAFLRAHTFGALGWWVGFYGCLLLGLMSHMSIAMLVPFCLYWRWRQGLDLRSLAYQLLGLTALLAVAGAFLLLFTAQNTSTWNAIHFYSEENTLGIFAGHLHSLLWFVSCLLTAAHWLLLPVYKMHTWELYLGGGILVGLAVMIWRRIFPEDLWAVWIIAALLPFVFLTEKTINDLPIGPSRYLYMASAGSSLLLAGGVHRAAAIFSRWRGLLYAGILVLLLTSSIVYLKRAEALSLYSSGRYYITHGDTQLGIERLKLAIAQDRGVINLEEAYIRLCQVLLFSGDADFVISLREALKNFPKSFALNVDHLVVNSILGDSTTQNQARQQLHALGRDEDFVARTYFNLGRGLAENENHELAIRAYERSLEFVPDRASTLKGFGVSLLKVERTEKAVSTLMRATKLTPDDPQTLYSAAFALKAAGRCERAIDLCYRAMQFQLWPDLFYLLGDCLEQADRTLEARDVYQRGIAFDPNEPQFHLRLNRVLAKMGDNPGGVVPK